MNRHLFKTVLEDSGTKSDDAESVAVPLRIGGTAAIYTPAVARAVASNAITHCSVMISTLL
jgi:hypothetical protein